MGKPTQTPQKKVVSETKKTPEHSEEYYRAVAILEARSEEKRLDEMGVPSAEDIAESLGIPVDRLLRSPGPVNYRAETDEEIEAMLPSLDQLKKDFGIVSGDKQVQKPLTRAAEQSKDYDENGIPTIEQMKKDFGIKI
jgi:seryl-tRNA synthetase